MSRWALRLALVTATTAGLVGLLLAGRLLSRPEGALLSPVEDTEALRFQNVVAQLLLRQGGLSQRTDPLVVTSAELNAFLSHHVESRRLAVWPVAVRVENGWLEVLGRSSPRRLLGDTSVRWLGDLLPGSVLDVDVWLAARGRLTVRHGQGEFLVDEASVGRQTVPRAWLWRLLGANPSDLLVWRMPRIVERVDLEWGRLVIHTSRPSR